MLPFLILLFLNQRVSAAQDPETITAELGQDITLPCQVSDKNILAGVEWSRRDLEPEYVLLLRDGRFFPEDQQPSFKGRVDLKERQMKDGDVSLILKKVTTDDTGTYECSILTQERKRSKRAVETIKVVKLSVVDPPGHTGGTTEDGGKREGGEMIGSVEPAVGLSVFAVLIVSAAVGFLIYRKRKQQPSQDSYQPPPEQQPV